MRMTNSNISHRVPCTSLKRGLPCPSDERKYARSHPVMQTRPTKGHVAALTLATRQSSGLGSTPHRSGTCTAVEFFTRSGTRTTFVLLPPCRDPPRRSWFQCLAERKHLVGRRIIPQAAHISSCPVRCKSDTFSPLEYLFHVFTEPP